MTEVDALLRQAESLGIELNDVTFAKIANRGLGIKTTRPIAAGSLLLFAPYTSMRTILTLPEKLREIKECSVNGLLAAELAIKQATEDPWLAALLMSTSLTDRMPIYWTDELQALLPVASRRLLHAQRSKIRRDWLAVSSILQSLVYDIFEFCWLSVSTRTFYYTSDDVVAAHGILETDDCLALIPFADYFNHASSGCSVEYSGAGYKFFAHKDLVCGEEVFFSYGNHDNDFLLVEYGFLTECNPSDAIQLDEVVLPVLSRSQNDILKDANYLGNYVLGNDFCYRTIVAVRLLVMPIEEWHKSLLEGFDDDQYQLSLNRKLLDIVQSIYDSTEEALQQLRGGDRISDHRACIQSTLLEERLLQVQIITKAAIEKLVSEMKSIL